MIRCGLAARAHRHAGLAAIILAAAALVAVPACASAQSSARRPPAFTSAQAERGKALYEKNCQDCHGSTLDNGEFGGAPLTGSYFRQHWGSGDVSACSAT